MKTTFGLRVIRHLGIGVLVAAATLSFATPAQARVLLGSPGPAALSDGLVGYWPLDGAVTNWATGKTNDLSGNGNDASLAGLSTSTSPIAGKIGQAITGTVTAAATPSLEPATFTVAEWVKINAAAPAFVSIGLNSSTGYEIDVQNNDISAGTNQFACISDYFPSPFFPIGSWQHVAFSYDGSQIKTYVNGSLVKSHSCSLTLDYSGASTLNIGDPYNTDSQDDIRIYNRALSAQEVQQLFNAGR
jgi:hypothetical protein